MNKPYVVYLFIDNSIPFYVGATKNFNQRRKQHKYDAIHRDTLPVHAKLKTLLDQGILIEDIMILQDTDLTKKQATKKEIKLIKTFNKEGVELCNIRKGGV